MTTYADYTVTCAACGTDNTILLLTSTSAFGPTDLDLRPPEPMRSTLASSVQYCSGCTRYALRLDDAEEMQHAPRLRPIDYSLEGFIEAPTAYVYRRRAERAAEAGDLSAAIHHFLCAAWLYDDHASFRADGCRERAAAALEAMHADGKTYREDQPTDLLLLADLHRRSGHFDQAITCADRVLAAPAPDLLHRIAHFQRTLATAQDPTRYTVADTP